MSYKLLLKLLTALAALALVAAACGSDDSDDSADTESTEEATDDAEPEEEATEDEEAEPAEESEEEAEPEEEATEEEMAEGELDPEVAALLPDNGPCDESLEPVVLAIQATFESPVLTLTEQRDGAQAAVDGFNSRGGVGGRCMELEPCNDEGDPNVAADCARSIVDSDAVASVNDTSSAGDAQVAEIFTAANFPRIGQSPGSPDLNAPNSYNLGGGGVGTSFMMMPSVLDEGYTQIAVIHVDIPAFQALPPILGAIAEANGAEVVGAIPVPAGTTNYDQFILSAEELGADAVIMPLGDAESEQVLDAAGQLGTDLAFGVSLGTFSQQAVQGLDPDIAANMIFNAEVPPATAVEQFPAIALVNQDFAEFGTDKIDDPSKVKSSSFRSWMAVYAFVTVMSETDTENITRESVTEAFNTVQDIDMLGIMEPWTPNAESAGAFSRISNPNYYFATWGGDDFVSPDQVNGNLQETLAEAGLG